MSDRPRRRDRTGLALGSEVLLIGAASGVPDKQRAHGAPPEGWPERAAGRGRPGHRAAPDLPERRSDSTSATASPAHNAIGLWPVWEVASPLAVEDGAPAPTEQPVCSLVQTAPDFRA